MPERQPPGDPDLGGRAREASLEVLTFEQSPVKRVRVWEANWVPSRGSWARRSELPHPQREVLEDGVWRSPRHVVWGGGGPEQVIGVGSGLRMKKGCLSTENSLLGGNSLLFGS